MQGPAARRRDRQAVKTRDRAQTVQDFAIGAGLFLLTVTFVFAFIPSIFTPFASEVSPGAHSQADRVAASIVHEHSIDGRPNWLTDDVTTDSGALGASGRGDLQDAHNLPETTLIHIELQTIDRSEIQDAGTPYSDQPVATISRIVVVKGISDCDPEQSPKEKKVCRLVVRVW